jgi:hypothetical protein
MSESVVSNQVKHDPGRPADTRPMRLLSTVNGQQVLAPVVQRNIGVWLGLALIVVILGLDLVGGGNAELLGLLVSPPILAASFVGPKRTAAVGVVALAAAIGYGRAVGVDLLAGSQGVPPAVAAARRHTYMERFGQRPGPVRSQPPGSVNQDRGT